MKKPPQKVAYLSRNSVVSEIFYFCPNSQDGRFHLPKYGLQSNCIQNWGSNILEKKLDPTYDFHITAQKDSFFVPFNGVDPFSLWVDATNKNIWVMLNLIEIIKRIFITAFNDFSVKCARDKKTIHTLFYDYPCEMLESIHYLN